MNEKSPDGRDSLFTDYTYDNLGLPRNKSIIDNHNPAFFDLGLCGPERSAPIIPSNVTSSSSSSSSSASVSDILDNKKLCGAFKVPSLRNVAERKFYFHNGYFNNLHDAVAFYATRDTNPDLWYPKGDKFNDLPMEYRANVNIDEVPYDRKKVETPALNEQEINDIVAFLKTLSDS